MADQDLVLTPEDDTGAGPQPSLDSAVSPAPVSKRQRGDYTHRPSDAVADFQQNQHEGLDLTAQQPGHPQLSVNHHPVGAGSYHHSRRNQQSDPTQLAGFEFDVYNSTSQHSHLQLNKPEGDLADERGHDLGEEHMDVQDQQPLTDTVRDGLQLMAQERDSILHQVRFPHKHMGPSASSCAAG